VEGGEVGRETGVVAGSAEVVEALGDGIGELVAGETAEVLEDDLWAWEGVGGGSWWNFDEDMEVVGEDGEGEDADAAERFAFAEEGEEVVLLGVEEDEAAVDDA
jgi:hypothetical protein